VTIFDSLDRALPEGSVRRMVVYGGLPLAALAFWIGVLLPQRPPGPVWARQFVVGCGDALLAAGLVLVWRSARVVNFAQAAIGTVGAYLSYILMTSFRFPFLAVLPLCIAIGVATGLLVNVALLQRFFNAPRLILTVVTIVVAEFLGSGRSVVTSIPFIKSMAQSLQGQDRAKFGVLTTPFAGKAWRLAGVPIDFNVVFAAIVCAAGLGGLVVWLRRSRLGTAVRGVAENAERAQSLGVNVRLVSGVVWSIAGGLSAVGMILHGLTDGFAYGTPGHPVEPFLIPALAAAVLARMTSIRVAVVSAFAISFTSGALAWAYPTSPAIEVGLLAVMSFGLLARRRRGIRGADADSSSWEATKEMRPIPKELASQPEVRRTRRGLIAVIAVVVLVLPFTQSGPRTDLFSFICIEGIVALSIVILTGWSGVISLGQYALVAVGAVVGANLTSVHHLSFWLALPAVCAFTGGAAVVLGLPALRVRGSFLAVTTLALAVATQPVLFHTSLARLIPTSVDRPRLLFVSLDSQRSYYFFCLGMLVLAVLVVRGLRRSRTGRVLIAARENEAGVEAFGVSLVRVRLAAFAISGAMAGAAGLLFAAHQRAVAADGFSASASVTMFVITMIGGIGTTAGAVLGAAFYGIINYTVQAEAIRSLLTNGGLLILLIISPGGLAALATMGRDSLLRILALRKNIPVPSLFADADIDAIVNRRAPLVARLPFRGLEAIPAARRYTQPSVLHGRSRPRQEVNA
jgi:branched-chain amino acid transport system permease protein